MPHKPRRRRVDESQRKFCRAGGCSPDAGNASNGRARHPRRHHRHHAETRPGKVLGVPPEEFGIERGARDIRTCNYCFHEVVTKTESQLIAEGFDEEQIKSLGDYTGNTEIETLARDTVRGAFQHLGRRREFGGAAGPHHRALCPDGLRGQRPGLSLPGHHRRRSGRDPAQGRQGLRRRRSTRFRLRRRRRCR